MRTRAENQLIDESEVSEIGTVLPSPVNRPTVKVVPKNRIFERKQGCYNCLHFDNRELARKHFEQRMQLDAAALLEKGRTLPQVEDTLVRVRRIMEPPKYGVCMKNGGGAADFKAASFLCEKWTGRVGVEGKFDVTADELYDKLGEKA